MLTLVYCLLCDNSHVAIRYSALLCILLEEMFPCSYKREGEVGGLTALKVTLISKSRSCNMRPLHINDCEICAEAGLCFLSVHLSFMSKRQRLLKEQTGIHFTYIHRYPTQTFQQCHLCPFQTNTDLQTEHLYLKFDDNILLEKKQQLNVPSSGPWICVDVNGSLFHKCYALKSYFQR